MFDNKNILSVLLKSSLLLICFNIYSDTPKEKKIDLPSFVTQQIALDGNNINSWIINSGIFDQNRFLVNSPGFEWPKGSGSDALFTCGLTIAAYVNNQLLMSSAMYEGEYEPGYVTINNGSVVAQTDARFHIYKVKRGDNAGNNPDWLNWGLMVPYGAPFVDVNHDGIYEPLIDTPGVKNAEQTIFICLTDGFPENHYSAEGFGGGTAPMFNEVHMTAWCYNTGFLQDVQFIKWDVINKNIYSWNKAYFSITTDPDLGCPEDDYIGCDTTRGLGFCYNGEDVDCAYTYEYTGVVPAVGIQWINCSYIQNSGFSSFDFFTNPASPGPVCERDPNPGAALAYNYMKGLKSDGTPWTYPPGGSSHVTKYCYSGDPETGNGWTEGLPGNPHGHIENCGSDTGQYISVNPFGDRRMVLSSGSDNLTVNPGDTQKIMIAQVISRGTSRLNSVTKLKQLADQVCTFVSSGFITGIKNESEQQATAHTFRVFPNYPNPFNPTTVIKFEIPASPFPSEGGAIKVTLKIYDILGKEVASLIPPLWGGQEGLKPGSYNVEWNASNFPKRSLFL